MHDFSLLYSPYTTGITLPFAPIFLLALVPVLFLIVLWTVCIKGYALWHAARNRQVGWFIALLVINTVGILEIVYLIWFRPTTSDTVSVETPKLES